MAKDGIDAVETSDSRGASFEANTLLETKQSLPIRGRPRVAKLMLA